MFSKKWGWLGVLGSVAALVSVSCGNSDTDDGETLSVSRGKLIEVPPNGGVITIANTARLAGNADAADARNATLNEPTALAVGPDGTIYVADWGNNSVRRIKPDGSLDTYLKGKPNLIRNSRGEFASLSPWQIWTGTWGVAFGISHPITSFGRPYDGSGLMYGLGASNGRGEVLQEVTGTDLAPYQTDIANNTLGVRTSTLIRSNVPAGAALQFLNASSQLLGSGDSAPFLARTTWTKVAVMSPQGPETRVPVGTSKLVASLVTLGPVGQPGYSYFDAVQMRPFRYGEAASNDAGLLGPSALALASNGDLWVGDDTGILIVNSSRTTFTRLADSGNRVQSISLTSDGTAYWADSTSRYLYARTPGPSGVIFKAEVTGYYNEEPLAVVATPKPDGSHSLWVTFRNWYVALEYTCPTTGIQAGAIVSCPATGRKVGQGNGAGAQGFMADMDGTSGGEKLGYSYALGLGRYGEVLIGDELNSAVYRSLLPFTQIAAGSGQWGWADGPSGQAKFNSPSAMAVTPDGGIVVADRINNAVRKILCASTNVCAGPALGTCPVSPIDDGAACTADVCEVLAIRHTQQPAGASCIDANLCTQADSCNASGSCISGPPLASINDDNACTGDTCDPATGTVTHTPTTIPDDGIDCTVGACDPATGTITYVAAPEGTACGVANSNRFCNHAKLCEAPSPVVIAPPLDTSTGTSFDQLTASLWSGPNPIQQGVAATKIEVGHAGWLIGQAKTAAGNPLPNVTVSVAGDASYGTTKTRADGRFDLVVNGGKAHVIRFEKAGHLPVDRQVYVGWEETALVADAILLTPDPIVTPLILGANGSGSTSFQVASGSPSSDDDGTRTGKVMIPKGTMATIGNQKQATLSVRLTEYTLGPDGPARMPAPLPPSSGYTYAVEVSADETTGSVKFTRLVNGQEVPAPIYYYLDNFLSVGVGKEVPSGYYDRDLRSWVPSVNGRVIKVIKGKQGVPDGSPAEIDVTGDNVKDDLTAPVMVALGITNDELIALQTYNNEKTLWRIPIDHMTPWDFNFATFRSCDATCQKPLFSASTADRVSCTTVKSGSIIGCETQTLGETLQVAGTPFSLNYDSSRAPLYSNWRTLRLGIREIPPDEDDSWTLATLTVTIAGKVIYSNTFGPGPYRTEEVAWDGLDAFGRPVVGGAIAAITGRWHGQRAWLEFTDVFGKPSPSPSPNGRIFRKIRPFSYELNNSRVIPAFSPTIGRTSWSLGGWTLSPHHFYDAKNRLLYMGSGETRVVDAGLYTVTRVLGSGGGTTFAPDNTSATATGTGINVEPYSNFSVAVASNGDVYFPDPANKVVRRINAAGQVKTIAGLKGTGNGNNCLARGDGGDSVINGRFASPRLIALGRDGELYVGDMGDRTIRILRPTGADTFSIDTVAGIPCVSSTAAPNGVAAKGTAISLTVDAIAVGPEGAVYFADPGSHTLRRFVVGGNINTVAGNGSVGFSGTNGSVATQVAIGNPEGIAVGRDGTVYSATTNNLYAVGPDGIMRMLSKHASASPPTTVPADNVPSTSEYVDGVVAVAVTPDDTVLFTERRSVGDTVRAIDRNGIVRTLSRSNPTYVAPPDGAAALGSGPRFSLDVATAPDGSVLTFGGDLPNLGSTLYRLSTGVGTPSSACTDVNAAHIVPSGDEAFCFNSSGRHLSTVNWRTKQKLLSFTDGAGGALVITDAFGRVTTIETVSMEVKITAPGKQLTTVTIGDFGNASKISDALGETTLSASIGGLLTRLTDRSLNTFTFGFAGGRLTSDASPLSSVPQTLVRSEFANGKGYRVTHTTPLGRQTTYDVTNDATPTFCAERTTQAACVSVGCAWTSGTCAGTPSDQVTSTTTLPDLTTQKYLQSKTGAQTSTSQDGTEVSIAAIAPNPTWGFRQPTPATRVVKLPGGALLTTTEVTCKPTVNGAVTTEFSGTARGATPVKCNPAAATDPLSDKPAATPAFVNPLHTTTKRDYDTTGETITRTSMAGRRVTTRRDAQGRTTSLQLGNLTPVLLNYETTTGKQWQLKTQSQGARVSTLQYRDVYESDPTSTVPDADAGFVKQVTDALGVGTTFKRDLFGRVKEQIEAKSITDQEGTTALGWDGNGNLKLVTPPTRPAHNLAYNGINFLQTYTPPTTPDVTTPATGFTTDPDRAPGTETRPDSVSLVRSYVTTPVNTGQLDKITFSGGSSPSGVVDYDYFAATDTNTALGQAPGKIKSIQGPYGATKLAFEYDGFLTKKVTWTNVGAATETSGSLSWGHDALFRRSVETVTPMVGSASVRYLGYDADDLITCVSATSGATCNPLGTTDLRLTRSAEHGLVTDLLAGSVSEHIEYSDSAPDNGATDDDVAQSRAFGELRSQSFKHGTTALGQIVYDASTERRDDRGRIRFKTETFGGTTTDIEYQYDERGRLEYANDGIKSETFAYDRNGNRTSYVPSLGAALIGTYDNQDRLTVYGTTTTGTAIGDIKYTYGANGELKKREIRTSASAFNTWNYTYDALGNLITVTKPGTSTTIYTYLVDALGRRIGKKEKIGTGADTLKKRWLYRDGLTPVAELTATGDLAARYVFGSRPNVPDLIIKGTKTYRLITDQLGSPRMAINIADSTDVPYRVDYSAFGVPTWKGTGVASTPAFDWIPFGFAGGLYDQDSGLVRFGARDYDPVVGRWVSKDPIHFRGRQANLFVYVANDPVNRVDPSGRVESLASCSYISSAVGGLACYGTCAAIGAVSGPPGIACGLGCGTVAWHFGDLICNGPPPGYGEGTYDPWTSDECQGPLPSDSPDCANENSCELPPATDPEMNQSLPQ